MMYMNLIYYLAQSKSFIHLSALQLEFRASHILVHIDPSRKEACSLVSIHPSISLKIEGSLLFLRHDLFLTSKPLLLLLLSFDHPSSPWFSFLSREVTSP